MIENATTEHGRHLVKVAVRATIAKLQHLEATGDLGGFEARNLWDEICMISRELGSGDPLFEAAEDTIRGIIVNWLKKKQGFEKAAIWFSTDTGFDQYQRQRDHTGDSESCGLSYDESDVLGHVTAKVMGEALNWSNCRIRQYEENGSEMEENGSEMDV